MFQLLSGSSFLSSRSAKAWIRDRNRKSPRNGDAAGTYGVKWVPLSPEYVNGRLFSVFVKLFHPSTEVPESQIKHSSARGLKKPSLVTVNARFDAGPQFFGSKIFSPCVRPVHSFRDVNGSRMSCTSTPRKLAAWATATTSHGIVPIIVAWFAFFRRNSVRENFT